MLLYKQKKTQTAKGNRFLISITVLGSAGPIRFVVNEEALVAAVIDTALKSYAREGRLPVLGSDLDEFMLYCPTAGPDGNFTFFFFCWFSFSNSKPIAPFLVFEINCEFYCSQL